MVVSTQCPACKSSIGSPDALFCGNCSKPLPRNLNCHKCGGALSHHAKYCEYCGALAPVSFSASDKQDVIGFCAGSGHIIRGGDPCFVCMECHMLYVEGQRFEDKSICLSCAFGSGMAGVLEQEKAGGKVPEESGVRQDGAQSVEDIPPAIEEVIGDELWVDLPAAAFEMGSGTSEAERGDDEHQHLVEVAAFQMLATPVTFAMYDQFCIERGLVPPEDEGWGRANRPAINVSYWDAVDFCGWLGERTGDFVRLPTEAEWEYACRAGTSEPYWTGESISTDQANFDGVGSATGGKNGALFRKKTVPVDLFQPNPWGFFDMCGNVWEWCASEYDAHYGGLELRDASSDGSNQSSRTLRGGSWQSLGGKVRSATRGSGRPDGRMNKVGFRVIKLNEEAQRRAQEEAARRKGQIERERKAYEAAALAIIEETKARKQAEFRAEEATRVRKEAELCLKEALAANNNIQQKIDDAVVERGRIESELVQVQQSLQLAVDRASEAAVACKEAELESARLATEQEGLEVLLQEEARKFDAARVRLAGLRSDYEGLVGELVEVTSQRDASMQQLEEVIRVREQSENQFAEEDELCRQAVSRLDQLRDKREEVERQAAEAASAFEDASRRAQEADSARQAALQMLSEAEEQQGVALRRRDESIRAADEAAETHASNISRMEHEKQAIKAVQKQNEVLAHERDRLEMEMVDLGKSLEHSQTARQALCRKHEELERLAREEQSAFEVVRAQLDEAVLLRKQAEQQLLHEMQAKDVALRRAKESESVREAIENESDNVQRVSELSSMIEEAEQREAEQTAAFRQIEIALGESNRDCQAFEARLDEAQELRVGLEHSLEELMSRLQQFEVREQQMLDEIGSLQQMVAEAEQGEVVTLPVAEQTIEPDNGAAQCREDAEDCAQDCAQDESDTVSETPRSAAVSASEEVATVVEVPEEEVTERDVGLARDGVAIDDDSWVSIPLGSYYMGSPATERGRSSDELQQYMHVDAFRMLNTAVTFSMFDAFCDATGRAKPSDEGWGRGDRPVINISYWDSEDYCRWLGGVLGAVVTLPTEVEWEYACRANTQTPYWTGEKILKEQANFSDGSTGLGHEAGSMTMPVGTFQPNPWGLFEMSGNVWEWCASSYHKKPVRQGLFDVAPADDAPRVLRGGAWVSDVDSLRSARRVSAAPTARGNKAGFRIVVRD